MGYFGVNLLTINWKYMNKGMLPMEAFYSNNRNTH